MTKCALVIGHTAAKSGARNAVYNISEFEFNERLINDLVSTLHDPIETPTIEPNVVYRKTYSELPNDVNAINPDFVVSFHCNAYNTVASGTETLYYHSSTKGKAIAKIFQDNIVHVLGLSNRGVKGKGTEDRGGYLLRYTKAPAVLLEPFFIDNVKDYDRVISVYDEFLQALRKSLFETVDYLGG
jgi:N-acetylmuramoyl-L-alanine amidase